MSMAFRCFLMVVIMGILGCNQSVSEAASRQAVSSEGLVFDPIELDMGEVLEGEQAKAVLLIRNNSKGFIQIAKVESSCGCTTAEPETHLLASGQFTPLHITVDTFGKLGNVRKSITLTDGKGKMIKAWLSLYVKHNPHVMGEGKRSIFDGKCASCHFEPAQGKTTGKAVYDAVCMMCHGENGTGGYAPSIRGKYEEDAFKQLVANGTGTSHMPGFAKKNKGPLSQMQIDALARWMLSLDNSI